MEPMDEDSTLAKRVKPSGRAHVSVDDTTTACPLFFGAHVSASYLEKVKAIVEQSDKAYFKDPHGYGARPLEKYTRSFETPLGSKLAGAAEHMVQSGAIHADVGQAFIDRMPRSVVQNVRAGAL